MGGWQNKFYDPDFPKLLANFHILFLQETWERESDNLYLRGYQAFTIPAIKISTRGRGSGGLAFLISVDLQVVVEELKQEGMDYVQFVLVKTPHLGMFLCINVYVPPRLANLRGAGGFWDQLSQLLESLTHKFPDT